MSRLSLHICSQPHGLNTLHSPSTQGWFYVGMHVCTTMSLNPRSRVEIRIFYHWNPR